MKFGRIHAREHQDRLETDGVRAGSPHESQQGVGGARRDALPQNLVQRRAAAGHHLEVHG